MAGVEAPDVDAVLCAASNHERAYPAIAIEIQQALVVNPEICSAHLEWRDRDCHFIFGDVATAVLLERHDLAMGGKFLIKSTRCAAQFSNNIRNKNGFLHRTREDHMDDRHDMLFMQEGRKVFKEVLPLVCRHIASHMEDIDIICSFGAGYSVGSVIVEKAA